MESEPPVPLTSIFDCARPILFANNSYDYPISFSGTGFLVSFRSKLYVVTAAHVLRDFSIEQIRVQYHPNSSDFIPLSRPYTISGDDADDTDQYDVLVLACDTAKVDFSRFEKWQPYTLRELDALIGFDPQSEFAFRGFPSHFRDVEYERRLASMHSTLGQACYLGPTGRAETHRLRVHRVEEFGSFDGLSGAPVFQVWHHDEKHSSEAFAGMLLRGTTEAGTVEMLEHRKVIDVLTSVGEARRAYGGFVPA